MLTMVIVMIRAKSWRLDAVKEVSICVYTEPRENVF